MKTRKRDQKGRYIKEDITYPIVMRVTMEEKDMLISLRKKRSALHEGD
ncbi:MAG: hypothetical protein ACFFCI_02355 [Promethearchaeota archaeon]